MTLADDHASLFDIPVGDPVAPRTLTELYVEPPVTTLDRRTGRWQERRRQWLGLGIQSELGRDSNATWKFPAYLSIASREGGTSIFDPVLCELVYRWWSRPGDRVLDPFAGGSVRGIVAHALGRRYQGIELRQEQVDANYRQVLQWQKARPDWIVGDGSNIEALSDGDADLIFTCPPYGDLEVYSDDPRDLSAMSWDAFGEAYREIIAASVRQLADDRFFAIVVGDVRAPNGVYRGLPHLTETAMREAGLDMYQEAIILDPFGSAQMTAARTFEASRKLTKLHQSLLVGVKGSWKRAAQRLRDDKEMPSAVAAV